MSAGIFRQDNPYNTIMGRIGDLAMLSVAWMVFSIPVFTIGASTSAACEVAREIVEDTDEGVFRAFWCTFKRRFGVSCLFTLLYAVVFGLGAFDLWWISRQSGDSASIFYGVTVTVFVIVAMLLAFDLWWISRQSGDSASIFYGVTVTVFVIVTMLLAFGLPLSGRSKLTVREQIAQSARLAPMKPLVALLIVALAALPIVLMALVPGAIMWVPLLWVILGFGVSFWVAMLATCKAFALKPADHQAQGQ
ncbi:YesL family protein [Bifidobacterium pseudolongum]|uniref:YesL family protein n=1 Tax=Bifidobacterium pseudolongum TaxID=1694 RepID=UPI00101F7841|nr:YesL family protein [Bifidobacterium pseudolongum]RYQ53808.1 transferase [Bifidobacterium pseudolongum subsp. pseudolongum]